MLAAFDVALSDAGEAESVELERVREVLGVRLDGQRGEADAAAGWEDEAVVELEGLAQRGASAGYCIAALVGN